MRTHGTLIRWNDERGFGFIEPAGGAEELFVHVSAFPRDGVRPHIGELVSFEIDTRGDGRKRAVRVMRPGSSSPSQRIRDDHSSQGAYRQRRAAQGSVVSTIGLLAVIALGVYVYSLFHSEPRALPDATATVVRTTPHAPITPTQHFTCDSRTMCSQMTSCAEATYFLQHCPVVKMDGDGDGVPCERQWCDVTHNRR